MLLPPIIDRLDVVEVRAAVLVSPLSTNLLIPDPEIVVTAAVEVVAEIVAVLPLTSVGVTLISLPELSWVRVTLLKLDTAKEVSLVEATGLLFDINRKSRLLPAYLHILAGALLFATIRKQLI